VKTENHPKDSTVFEIREQYIGKYFGISYTMLCSVCVLLSGSEERVEYEANTNTTWHNQVASFR
jgi:hypothetical protein